MEQYILYLTLKEIFKDTMKDLGYKMSFNDIDIKAPKAVGCYVRGSVLSKYRDLASGQYINVENRVTFNINAGLTKDELMDGLCLCNELKYNLIPYSNHILTMGSLPVRLVNGHYETAPNLDGVCNVVISSVSLLSDILPLGKNEQGISQYSINFKITYKIEEV
jgi:hypothetical protein